MYNWNKKKNPRKSDVTITKYGTMITNANANECHFEHFSHKNKQ